MKKTTIYQGLRALTAALAIGAVTTSCDFLDKGPLDQISPDTYYSTAEQLSSFTIDYYSTVFPGLGGYNGGKATWDNGTDNQAATGGNLGMFTLDRWKVPSTGGIGFGAIRDVNKFINENEARHKEGKISGRPEDINQAIGEAYAIRGMLYYDKLYAFGDFPIVDKVLNVDEDLAGESKRMPRNEVARHILKDLDKAIELLPETTPRNQRLSKRSVLALKSRVALFEGTFELYHRGSGRVPGDATWPGKDKEWNKGKTFDQAVEVDFFLSQAMDAAKEVGDAVSLQTENTHIMNPTDPKAYSGWNPYYDMYASPDLSVYPEILFWEEFGESANKLHFTSHYLARGFNSGWTRGLVESFLMDNGLPIYAPTSGYKGDKTISMVKTDRDERLQLFMYDEKSKVNDIKEGGMKDFGAPEIIAIEENRDVTGYRQRKFCSYDPAKGIGTAPSDDCGLIHVRVEEAYLNYIEASYLKNHSIDATARKYWDALRKRAGITAPIETTIAATDMSYEADLNRSSYDWGAFSAGQPIDATLYSIRRERRCELAGEGFRMEDLKRWRAMDQVKNYHIEGINLWDEIYKSKKYVDEKTGESQIEGKYSDGGEDSKVSSREVSKYLRPYQIRTKYDLYGGYTFYEGHYLSPFSIAEMQLCSPDNKAENSYLYQNIYWPTGTGHVTK